ncbi:hypothetical protein Y048_6026 [Burkholderia pseudomallei MSHR456]|nr:hypothetical protein Y048_6026 [Burkholderia pseudomallei MSHR456]
MFRTGTSRYSVRDAGALASRPKAAYRDSPMVDALNSSLSATG